MTKQSITHNGKTITVEIIRNVTDKIAYADGYNLKTGREVIDQTIITIKDGNKELARGSEISPLYERFDAKMIKAGALGKIGNVYLGGEMHAKVTALLAEVNAATPKSEEQIAIETEKAARITANAAWHNSAEAKAHRKFVKEMERADSDY